MDRLCSARSLTFIGCRGDARPARLHNCPGRFHEAERCHPGFWDTHRVAQSTLRPANAILWGVLYLALDSEVYERGYIDDLQQVS